MYAEYNRYPARIEVIYCWRTRRRKVAILTDIGRTLPVEPIDAEEYAPVESWTIFDCIDAALRESPNGLTAKDIAERVDEPVHNIQRNLSIYRNTRYIQVGKIRSASTGKMVFLWALGAEPFRKNRPGAATEKIAALLRQTPGLTAREISERTGIAWSTAQTVLSVADCFVVVGTKRSGARPNNLWAVE